MKNINKFFIGIAVGILLSIAVPKLLNNTNTSNISIDSTYINKKIILPEIKLDSTLNNPKPIVTYNGKKLDKVEKFEKIKIDSIKVEKYVEAVTPRVYENTYTSKDSIATVVVTDSVDGFLRKQNVSINVKERPIEYKEYTITKTIKERPALTLSLGAAVRANQYNLDKTAVVGLLGIKGKKGTEFIVGYDSNQYFTIGIKKDIFTLYK